MTLINQILNGFTKFSWKSSDTINGRIYCRIKKAPFVKYFDLVIPEVALAQGFGRMGCFFAGCCYGRETDLPIGIIFKNSAYAPNGVKLMPTQLISSAGDFLIAAVLFIYARKERDNLKVGSLYMIMYSIGRLLIEFLRDDYRGSIGFMSTSQILSVIIFAAGVIMWIMGKKICKAE